MDLYVNGRKTIEDTQPPFAFAWDTTTLANGSYTLVAYAFDAAGNQGTSSTVNVTVKILWPIPPRRRSALPPLPVEPSS